jgi:hypothetical protein
LSSPPAGLLGRILCVCSGALVGARIPLQVADVTEPCGTEVREGNCASIDIIKVSKL